MSTAIGSLPSGDTTVESSTDHVAWVWMAAAFAVTGVSQLASQMVLGRLLGAADYGQAATLFNLMSFVGVPLVAVQLTVTGLVARGGSMHATLVRYGAAGVAAGIVAVAAASLWGGALAVNSVGACRVAALFLPATFLLAVARGNAVGLGRSRRLATAMTVSAVVRLGASALAATWFGIAGAAGAAVAAELVLGAVLLVTVRPAGSSVGAIVGRETAGATYTQVAMWLIVNVDLLWARRLLGPDDAGRYLAVGSVAVGLVSFGQAFLWHRASASTDAAAGIGIVRRSAVIVAVAAIIGVPAAAVGMPVLLGPEFGDLTPLLVIAGMWAVLASVVQTGTATQLISGRRGLRRIVPMAAIAVVAPPMWVGLIGARPIALSIAATVNAALGALVVMAPSGGAVGEAVR